MPSVAFFIVIYAFITEIAPLKKRTKNNHWLPFTARFVYFCILPPFTFMADQIINVRPPIWALIGAVALGGVFYISGKQIESKAYDPSQNGTITVSGDARVFVAPDIGELSLGIQTGRQATASAAMEKLKTGMDKVIAAVKAQGIEEKDIRSESFYLNPVYDWTNGQQVPRGFEATQSLRIKVRDLDKVSEVLGAATAAGANQAGSVNFTVDEPDAKRAEARQEAIDEAKQKARELAGQLGVHLGEIVNFSEGYGGSPMPPIYYSRDAYGVGGAANIAEQAAVQMPAGEQEISVSVSITYEID